MMNDERPHFTVDADADDADKLFLTLMQNHHLGGAHMADYEAQNGADPMIREMAAGMAKNQRVEVNEYQSVIDRLNNKT